MSEYVLETQNLGISFGGLKAVQGLDLKIKKNQIYGMVGPNGAGKTTVFNMPPVIQNGNVSIEEIPTSA